MWKHLKRSYYFDDSPFPSSKRTGSSFTRKQWKDWNARSFVYHQDGALSWDYIIRLFPNHRLTRHVGDDRMKVLSVRCGIFSCFVRLSMLVWLGTGFAYIYIYIEREREREPYLTPSLPWYHLKTTFKSVKFETHKPFWRVPLCISTWRDFHQNARYWK